MRLVTIGVYGFTEERFFEALQQASVDTVCDIRRRRGVRGSAYAFANSRRLQARLDELGIHYIHRLDLAPPTAVRALQHQADRAARVPRRQRSAMDPAFLDAYQDEVLASFDPQSFFEQLPPEASVVALLCVEQSPDACHRSLVARRLRQSHGLAVEHLVP
jgi:uncharacterized protein (DUF488 family)